MTKIWLVASSDWVGRLIRFATFSRWNHAAIEIDGVVYESVAPGGVRVVSAPAYAGRWKRAEAVAVKLSSPSDSCEFLRAQVGKPYDWGAVLALPFRAKWQSPEKWFCSELVYEALRVGGGLMPGRLPANRVTPRDLWVALPDVGER